MTATNVVVFVPPGGLDLHVMGWIAPAVAVAFVSGLNDGGTLLTVHRTARRPAVPVALLSLAAAVVVVPMIFGTAVAATLSQRLVSFDGNLGALTIALAAAASTVAWHMLRGSPTSLSLALVGGIVGAGWGAGLPVTWTTTIQVLALAMVAPSVGFMAAALLHQILSSFPGSSYVARQLGSFHAAGFLTQCVAYAINDGQKALAVLAVAAGAARVEEVASPLNLTVLGLAFLAGAAIGALGIGARNRVSTAAAVSPAEAVTAGFSSSMAVAGGSVLGMPVSMTQALAASSAGSRASDGWRRVRWEEAAHLVVAWAWTLPLAGLLAALVATTVRIAL